jgi:hypothetical protein
MPDNVFIVLSKPPADLPEDTFNAWYELHATQILQLPAFVAAERHKLRFVRGTSGNPPDFAYSIRYEIEGDFETAWAQLRDAVDNGRMEIPDWFAQVHTEGWHGTPLGERYVKGA